MLFYLSSAVLAAALLLGGGTHVGFLGDVALQFLAIPLLCMALWPAFSQQSLHRKKARLALWICGVAALVAAIQLSPLHLDYWSGATGLLPASSGALPAVPGAHTLTLTPEAGWAAALSLILPLSDFCRQRSAYSRTAHSPLLSIGRAGSCVASYRLSADGPRVREQPALLRVHEPN